MTEQNNQGFTFIEMTVVILLLALMTTLAVTNFGALDNFHQRADLRRFINTWEMLSNESRSRREAYRLVIDFNRNVYYVRREVPLTGAAATQVDRLAGFRTKSELERRAQEQEEKLDSLAEEYAADESVRGGSLEQLFYRSALSDPYSNVRLGIPIEFPSLKEDQPLRGTLRFRDVVTSGKILDEGQTYIRFSANGASEFAVVHITSGDQVFTAVINPASGRVKLHNGDLDFEWTLGKSQEAMG